MFSEGAHVFFKNCFMHDVLMKIALMYFIYIYIYIYIYMFNYSILDCFAFQYNCSDPSLLPGSEVQSRGPDK